MGRRTRGGLAAAASLLAASCALVAPLDGLTGGTPPQTDDATAPSDGATSTDAPAERAPDATRDALEGDSSAPESGTADATVDAREAGAEDAGADRDGSTPDAADAGSHDTGSPVDASPDAPSSVYAAAVLADAPLAYWRLGETSGTVAHDETGHGYDGTYSGTYTLGTPGALAGDPNTAVTLDGVTGQVDVGDNFDFTGQVPFSLEAWVKPAVIDSVYRHVVTKMAFDGSGNPQVGSYVILQKGSTILGFERWQAATAVLAVEDAVFPAAGAWAHVVATYDGTTGSLYVNGTLVHSATSLGGVTASGVHMLWGNVMQGVLDEIAVYGAALPAARVTAHYQAAQ